MYKMVTVPFSRIPDQATCTDDMSALFSINSRIRNLICAFLRAHTHVKTCFPGQEAACVACRAACNSCNRSATEDNMLEVVVGIFPRLLSNRSFSTWPRPSHEPACGYRCNIQLRQKSVVGFRGHDHLPHSIRETLG